MRQHDDRGTTLLEIVAVAGVAIVLIGMAVPFTRQSEEQLQVMAAIQFLSSRVAGAHTRAVMSGAAVGLRFRREAAGYAIQTFRDGDGDGISAADMSTGVDRAVEPVWRLSDKYPAVHFGLGPGIPSVGGQPSGTAVNPVRLGGSGILSFSPLGTASSGTLYVRGRRSGEQYALRVLGVTGRVRVLRYEPSRRAWVDR